MKLLEKFGASRIQHRPSAGRREQRRGDNALTFAASTTALALAATTAELHAFDASSRMIVRYRHLLATSIHSVP